MVMHARIITSVDDSPDAPLTLHMLSMSEEELLRDTLHQTKRVMANVMLSRSIFRWRPAAERNCATTSGDSKAVSLLWVLWHDTGICYVTANYFARHLISMTGVSSHMPSYFGMGFNFSTKVRQSDVCSVLPNSSVNESIGVKLQLAQGVQKPESPTDFSNVWPNLSIVVLAVAALAFFSTFQLWVKSDAHYANIRVSRNWKRPLESLTLQHAVAAFTDEVDRLSDNSSSHVLMLIDWSHSAG